jgi:hypothetical protein
VSIILGIGYKKGSGKNTLGKLINTYLQRCCGKCVTKQVSFAEKLKDISYQLYGWAGLKRGIYYETHYDEKEVELPQLDLTPRDIWIGVGNGMRGVYTDTWINYALHGVKANVVLITDMGFTNEATAIKKAGGFTCKITREGIPRGMDARETELDSWTNWDFKINNNGGLSDLNHQAEAIGNFILEKI